MRSFFQTCLRMIAPSASGPIALPESAIRCTRCGACAQSCPSYACYPREVFSPRGRAQFLCLLYDGQIKPSQAKMPPQWFESCLLCAQCSAACPGAVPVAHQMLALRRFYGKGQLSKFSRSLLRLRHYPFIFGTLLALFQILRRLGLSRLLGWGYEASILPKRFVSLRKTLKKNPITQQEKKPALLYLPSLEALYLDGELGVAALQLAKPKSVCVLWHYNSGLFETLYGFPAKALRQARALLRRWQQAGRPPLLTDSVDVYLFLRNYPLIFPQTTYWQQEAQAFAKQVRFVTHWTGHKFTADSRAALYAQTVLFPGDETSERAQKIISTHFGKNFVQCAYSRSPLSGLGALALARTTRQRLQVDAARQTARVQAQYVWCLSAWSAWELDAALRKHYPQAQARHILYLQAAK